ncbi:MAG: hypothetical protein Q7U74_01100, partial [Saprospiraceae bacterium]|nr:hypothetical protein [Saprospiraceae bacterium]
MLATGRYVAQTGQAPTVDVWSHTAYGQPWPFHEWLSSLFFYLIYSASGINGLIIFKALILALAFFLGLQIMRLRGASPFAALLSAFLAMLVLNLAFAERIQIFSFLFFLLSLYLLELFRNGRIKKGIFLSGTVVMFAVWSNMHLGYMIGLGLYGLAMVDGLFAGFKNKEWNYFKWSMAALVLAVLSTGINPYGFALTTDALSMFYDPASKEFDVFIWKSILEHQPLLSPGFSREPFVVYALIWIGFSGLGLLLNLKKTRVSEWLVYTVFVYQAFYVTRYMWFLVWLSFPFTAANWQGVFDHLNSKFNPSAPLRAKIQNSKFNISGNSAFALLILLILVGAGIFQRSGEHLWQRFQLGWRARMNSERGVQFLKQHRGESRVFNDFDIGAYLLWQQVPVFVDGRILPYKNTQVLQDQFKIFGGRLDLLDKYQID